MTYRPAAGFAAGKKIYKSFSPNPVKSWAKGSTEEKTMYVKVSSRETRANEYLHAR